MSQENPFQNPHNDSTSHRRHAHLAQRTSALAILSLISGLLSVPLMCMCVTAVPFSVGAIVMGHMSRGVVRDTNGQYGGIEMGTFGMMLGYCTLAFTSVGLLFYAGSSVQNQNVVIQTSGAANVLLQQAESQLLSGTAETTFGVTTCDASAMNVARHYVESLHVLDSTYFSETEADNDLPPRAYRAFVQLNEDSAAFLLYIPEYQRFTDEARNTVIDSSWVIARRSLEGVLPADAAVAVVLYSDGGRHQIMTGIRGVGNGGVSSPEKMNAPERVLSKFFRVSGQTPKSEQSSPALETTSEIDTRPLDEIPAELE